ncbi:MAG: dihydroorotate dehydrogenase [Proteobacteria bacterium]|nr:dihydroorotate dehydrogenase [Pseudomonadota bacterium]
MVDQVDLRVSLGDIKLKNPVMSASGTFGYGQEYENFVDPAALGAVVTKGVSLNPRPGNPPPRIVETPAGMINAIGLENVGVESFIRDKLPWLAERGALVVANILGESVEEYEALARRLDQAPGLAMIEVNVSCPNVAAGGLAFGADPATAARVTSAVVRATRLPVMVKLPPLVSDVTAVARAAVDAGARAISLINTIPAMALDIETRRPRLANTIGGLSGPAIKPVALRLVWQTARAVSVPVIGIGGIMNAVDALEFMLAGASAVQVGTASFVNPRAVLDIIAGIETFLRRQGLADLKSWIGRLETL